jgi:polygalacturonase
MMRRALAIAAAVLPLAAIGPTVTARETPTSGRTAATAPVLDVRAFGAKGDGRTLDTDAINAAVSTAAAQGGGVVQFPPGVYASFSIRLKSHVTLRLGPGATLLAADPASGQGRYDSPEPNEWDLYQDFGHSHWQNSLIWGIGLEDVSIEGPGRIDGRGLTRRGPGARWKRDVGSRPLSMGPASPAAEDPEAVQLRAMDGQGNKAISLKLCRNVVLRDVSILDGGHFAVLATGVDNLTIDALTIDTNRDGIDVDACRNVRISNSSVNSPNDDAIVLKSSYALGELRATENVTITNCVVSGYDVGTVLGGTFGRTQAHAPDRDGPTGRIKLGTESNGGFRNIAISNCVFDRCRGLALETVDGGPLEDVVVTNLTMREVTTAPIFLRIGDRGRGPGTPPVGSMRRVSISNVVASGVEPRFAAVLSGIPGHPVEDVLLSNVRLLYHGGGSAEDAARRPPENETAYPEPSMFGVLPAYGLFARHVRGLVLREWALSYEKPEARPALVLEDLEDAYLDHVAARRPADAAFCVLRDVRGLLARDSFGQAEMRRERAADEALR